MLLTKKNVSGIQVIVCLRMKYPQENIQQQYLTMHMLLCKSTGVQETRVFSAAATADTDSPYQHLNTKSPISETHKNLLLLCGGI